MSEKSSIKGVVDIVVLMDVTGSMQTCIDAVKRSVATFISTMTDSDTNNSAPITDWRLKVIGYRDHAKDGSDWFVDNPFVRDVAAVQDQFASDRMQAEGGGDEPESLLDALYLVASMGEAGLQDAEDPTLWRARGRAARAVIFFTDAPYRRQMTIPEAAGGQYPDLHARLTSARIILCGFHPEWIGYDELAAVDKAQLLAVATVAESPAIADLGKDGPAGRAAQAAAVDAMNRKAGDPAVFVRILEQLAKSLSKSVSVEIA